MPKKPMTTDGIEAMISMAGLMISRTDDEASSERYRAIERLNGTAMAEARSVTDTDAVIRGKTPKRGLPLVGYQLVPARNSPSDTLLKMGRPSLKRKIMISNRTRRQEKPITKKDFSIKKSK